LRRGWYWGAETFRQEFLAQMEEKIGHENYGAERHETAEAKAERIVQEEMKKLGWRKEDLVEHAKGHARKVRIASRLRQDNDDAAMDSGTAIIWELKHTWPTC
jgi:hypothetical protein